MYDVWHRLRSGVKNCPYRECPRNPENPKASCPLPPLLFSRDEGSLGDIRCVVVSQEPGASLRKHFGDDVDAMEEKLRKKCKDPGVSEKGTSPVNMMIRIFRHFDLEHGPVYWTHALKCVPVEDPAIKKQWKQCAHHCIHHLESELSALPSDEIAVVAIGSYALAACRHLFFRERLRPPKITEYIRAHGEPQKANLSFGEREKLVHLTAFIHPSFHNIILKKYDFDGRIAEHERSQEVFLKKFCC
jgi:hypothetical protein